MCIFGILYGERAKQSGKICNLSDAPWQIYRLAETFNKFSGNKVPFSVPYFQDLILISRSVFSQFASSGPSATRQKPHSGDFHFTRKVHFVTSDSHILISPNPRPDRHRWVREPHLHTMEQCDGVHQFSYYNKVEIRK